MTTVALILVLAIGGAAAYWFPETRKFAYFIMAVCTFIWFLTVLGVLPAQVRLP